MSDDAAWVRANKVINEIHRYRPRTFIILEMKVGRGERTHRGQPGDGQQQIKGIRHSSNLGKWQCNLKKKILEGLNIDPEGATILKQHMGGL
jgi:hypothetical protein